MLKSKKKSFISKFSTPLSLRQELKFFALILSVLWTGAIILSLIFIFYRMGLSELQIARMQALSFFEKDILYRRWAAIHGGIYAPISEFSPPNPYLKVPEREISTPSGKKLTLINPAYMTRQVYELSGNLYSGHLTSLNPIRPENIPDEWEKQALQKFDQGWKEFSSRENINGDMYLRFMRPLITEESCLKCHADQGYKLGDVRGGISISLSMLPFRAISAGQKQTIGLFHILFWLMGLGGIWSGFRRLGFHLSEREKSEQELKKANDNMEQALRIKSEFMANMSHEIRTPMNGVLGMTEILLGTRLSNEQREYANIILSSGGSLLRIINEILDFSKLESGKMLQENNNFDLSVLLGEFVSSQSVMARKKGLYLRYEFDPDIPLCLNGDSGRLIQVLGNLVGNAIKFTAQGGIFIRISLLEIIPQEESVSGKRLAHLLFSVRDTGIGVPADKIKLIFEDFVQADSSITRKYGGTGLGLAICEKIVKLMDGEIGVQSEEGQGSEFWFKLKIEIVADESGVERPCLQKSLETGFEFAGRKIRILLAEDNLVNQSVARGMLEKTGLFHVDIVQNGREAIEVLETVSYDLVFMDIQMPEMDGYEAIAIIRDPQSAVLNHNIPVIAMTAHALSDFREKSLLSGMNDHISKPFSTKDLVTVLKKWVPDGDNFANMDKIGDGLEKDFADGSAVSSWNGEELKKKLGYDMDAFLNVVQMFPFEAQKAIQFLEEALADSDMEKIRTSAHKLKGMAASISADSLFAEAAEIERSAKKGDVNYILFRMENLRLELENVEKAINQLEN